MKLIELKLPIYYEEAKNYALVFSQELAQRLSELHSKYGSNMCVPTPSLLSDGRLLLCADVLTEVGPGGLLESMWLAADKNVLFNEVEVIPWAEALDLLPQEIPEEIDDNNNTEQNLS